jgi:hypothetical protein
VALPALATTEQASAYSNGQVSASDPRLTDALDGASAAIRRYCGWHITPNVTETLILDGPGGRLLSLPTLYLTDVVSLVNYETTLASTDYRWSEDGSVKKKYGCWTDEFRAITAGISHGYDAWDVADIARVAMAVVIREMSSPTGATREQAGAVSISWAVTAPGVSGGIALLQHERDILDHFRIVGA